MEGPLVPHTIVGGRTLDLRQAEVVRTMRLVEVEPSREHLTEIAGTVYRQGSSSQSRLAETDSRTQGRGPARSDPHQLTLPMRRKVTGGDTRMGPRARLGVGERRRRRRHSLRRDRFRLNSQLAAST